MIISKEGRRELYSFPYQSAGPFGEDVVGEWMTADNFSESSRFRVLVGKTFMRLTVLRQIVMQAYL